MSTETFSWNNPEGTFRVFSEDGRSVFDSRLMTQTILLTGVLDIQGRALGFDTNGNIYTGIDGNATVLFGKTFSQRPYVRAASRRLYSDTADPENAWTWKIYGPRAELNNSSYYNNAINIKRGYYTNSMFDRLFIASLDPWGAGYNGYRRFWYAVFDNPSEGS